NTQGRLDIQSGTTLLQFLAETGGLTRFAATKRSQLHRPDKKTGLETVYNFNYKAIQGGAKAPVIVLRDGDVIVAPERKLFEQRRIRWGRAEQGSRQSRRFRQSGPVWRSPRGALAHR